MWFHWNESPGGIICMLNLHSWKMLFSSSLACLICRIKPWKRSVWHCPNTDMSQKWRLESMKCRLCWVYHFLNVALPFTVASPCVGERVCACIRSVSVRADVGVCLQTCVFCTKCVGVSMGLSVLVALLCVSRWPKDRCGCTAFQEADVKDL